MKGEWIEKDLERDRSIKKEESIKIREWIERERIKRIKAYNKKKKEKA